MRLEIVPVSCGFPGLHWPQGPHLPPWAPWTASWNPNILSRYGRWTGQPPIERVERLPFVRPERRDAALGLGSAGPERLDDRAHDDRNLGRYLGVRVWWSCDERPPERTCTFVEGSRMDELCRRGAHRGCTPSSSTQDSALLSARIRAPGGAPRLRRHPQ
jgi:hypothetical protein